MFKDIKNRAAWYSMESCSWKKVTTSKREREFCYTQWLILGVSPDNVGAIQVTVFWIFWATSGIVVYFTRNGISSRKLFKARKNTHKRFEKKSSWPNFFHKSSWTNKWIIWKKHCYMPQIIHFSDASACFV